MIGKMNPATLEPLDNVPESDIGSIGAMVAKAREAQLTWTSWPLERRKAALISVRDLLGMEYLTIYPHLVGDPYSKAVEQMGRFVDDVLPLLS